jgi:hypothetical protein
MTIKVTYNVTDVYVTQDVSPVYINVSYSGGGGSGAAVWGGITGTLSDQTDLQTALDGKFDDPTGTTAQYIRGDGSLATFPSLTGFVPYTGATGDVNLGTHRILAQNATISSSGSGDTVTLNHSSGSGVGLNITKGGNGEGLYINKTSGSGNAATIIGIINATTFVKSGGTSSQFLKADGTVDSSVYVPTSREITINGVTFDLSANRTFTVGSVTGSGASGQVAYWDGMTSQAGSNNLFWDAANGNLGIGTNAPATTDSISIVGSSSNRKSIVVQNTNSGGNSSFYFQNNRGLFASYGGLLHGGSTYPASFFGTSAIDRTILLSDGASSTGMMLGTLVSTELVFGTNNTRRATITASTGNILINSTTDGGQRLQVQGTTLLNGNVTFSSSTGMTWDATNSRLGIGTNAPTTILDVKANRPVVSITDTFTSNRSTTFFGAYDDVLQLSVNRNPSTGVISQGSKAGSQISLVGTNGIGSISFYCTNNNAGVPVEIVKIFGTSNVLIQNGGTFSDSGERLQVTGTMKVTDNVTLTTNVAATKGYSATNSNSVGTATFNITNNLSTNGFFRVYGSAFGSGTYSELADIVGFGSTKSIKIFTDASVESGGTNSIQFMAGGYNNDQERARIGTYGMLIGTKTSTASSILTLASTTQGFLPPRMTNAQRTAISSPAVGLIVYCTDMVEGLYVYKSAGWTFVI